MPYIGIGNNIAKSRSPSWTQLWKTSVETLFISDKISALPDVCVDEFLYNDKIGATDYLIVNGTRGSYTFQCPNTAPYIAADTDYIWFRTDGSQRTTTEAELIGYDLQMTPVKYLDDSPNSIEAIMILSSAVTGAKRDKMFKDFHLPILWDNDLNLNGVVKSNRGGTQELWTAEILTPSALILTVLSDTEIKVDWTSFVGFTGGFKIERGTNGVDYTQIDTSANTTFTNTGLTNNTIYYYRVRYYSGDYNSDYCTAKNTWTAQLMTLTKGGAGTGVGFVRFKFSVETVITLVGVGSFYSDAAGTADASTSHTWAANTSTIRYTRSNGTTKMLIFHKNTMIEWGSTIANGAETGISISGAPLLSASINKLLALSVLNIQSGVSGTYDITLLTDLFWIRVNGIDNLSGRLNCNRYWYLYINNANTIITGDLGTKTLTSATYLRIDYSRITEYTAGAVWGNATITVTPSVGYGLDSTEVDNMLIDMAASPALISKVIDLRGSNASRTAASNAAVATLEGVGRTNAVYTN